MDEYSRILIEEYCMQTDSAFIKKGIEQEEDDSLREVLKDLNGFMFGW